MADVTVKLDALTPFRFPASRRPEGDPAPLPYLSHPDNEKQGAIDLTLEVWLRSAKMRARGDPAMRVSQARFHEMYWTLAQMLTHHASNGCNLETGDLIASGTPEEVAANPKSVTGKYLQPLLGTAA